MDKELSDAIGGAMVEHMLQFARGINNVLEHEGAEAFLLSNPKKVQELDEELKQVEDTLSRVRQP